MTDRESLRVRLRAARSALDADTRRAAADAVRATLLAWDGLHDPVLAYLSVGGELGTRALVEALRPRGVLLPRVLGPGMMEAAVHTGVLEPGPHGIPAPTGPVGSPRVVLVPGVAFDRAGNRLGQGGGFYDRWLRAHPDVVSVGLCHDLQIVDAVPMDPHDRPVDRVLAPSGWIR